MGGRKARSDAANIPSEGNVQRQDGSLTLYGTKRQISSTSARSEQPVSDADTIEPPGRLSLPLVKQNDTV
jgi:hypothetical protein